MPSVTTRIGEVRQPKGGFIPRTRFKATKIDDGILLEKENIDPRLVGITVDYLTRMTQGCIAQDAFSISLLGARNIHKEGIALSLLKDIKGLSRTSVANACRLASFDKYLRTSIREYTPVESISPDEKTINNIITMVNRGIIFFRKHGPVVMNGVTFPGGYTITVDSGDGDFLTSDTLWDFKVSTAEPTSKHTLQLLVYYIMGCHSIHREFQKIQYLGIFNPRLNKVYRLDIANIDEDVIKTIEREVICY